jgi:hypothetical protein
MEGLLVEAASSLQDVEVYRASTSATAADISSLLEHAVHMRPGTHLHHRLLRVLPFLTYANRYPVPTFNSVPSSAAKLKRGRIKMLVPDKFATEFWPDSPRKGQKLLLVACLHRSVNHSISDHGSQTRQNSLSAFFSDFPLL